MGGEVLIATLIEPDLTPDEARDLTDRIKTNIAEVVPMIHEAFERRADRALGYPDWFTYCDAELLGVRLPVADRREAVAELRDSGMSQRAIGAALGVGVGTVNRDLGATVPDGTVAGRVRGLDGKNRPATRPQVPNGDSAPPAPPRTSPGLGDEPDEPAPSATHEQDPEGAPPADEFAPEEPVGGEEAGDEEATEPAGDPQALVNEALNKFLGPDTEKPRRELQDDFLRALKGCGTVLSFDVVALAVALDERCAEQLTITVKLLNQFHERVLAARVGQGPDLADMANVLPFSSRAAS